jgi:hypothetical protein
MKFQDLLAQKFFELALEYFIFQRNFQQKKNIR